MQKLFKSTSDNQLYIHNQFELFSTKMKKCQKLSKSYSSQNLEMKVLDNPFNINTCTVYLILN